MKNIIYLAFRNLTRQKRRNAMLAIAIAYGFFIVTAIDALASGAVDCLEDQIMQLNGGNVFVEGVEHEIESDGTINKKMFSVIRNPDFIENIFKEINCDYEFYSQRTATEGSIIFNNKKIAANVYGCDFSKEDHLLSSFVISEGSLDNLSNKNPMIITEKNAESLNVKIGDTVLYSTTTVTGQKNVDEFTVSIIIKESSLMGSLMIYASKDTINDLVEMPKDGFNLFSINLKDKSKQNIVAAQIEQKIRESGETVTSRTEAYQKSSSNPAGQLRKQINNLLVPGTIYISFSLNDAVPQMQQVVTIVHTITTCILLVILLIVMVGISNTYRMILYERIREIGTMRAVGMTGKDSGKMFTVEALILSLIGACAGLILAIIVVLIVSAIPIENEMVSFFLRKQHLTYIFSIGSILVKYIIMILLTILAVRGTAKSAARLSPAEALRSTK